MWSPDMQEPPQELYKIVTEQQLAESQSQEHLILSDGDKAFIHFSTEEQYPQILKKLASKSDETYIVLKIETKKLIGEMKFEANPGKQEKYYHLYDGAIPMSAVSEETKPAQGLGGSI